MIHFDEAPRIVLDAAQPLPSERVNLTDALGRVLTENVASDTDIPPFDKSAMDGYACRREDLANPLRVIETVPAGGVPTKRTPSWRSNSLLRRFSPCPAAGRVIRVQT